MEYSINPNELGYIMPTPSEVSNTLYVQDLMGFMSEEPLNLGMINSETPDSSMNLYGINNNTMGAFNDVLADIKNRKEEANFKQESDKIMTQPLIDNKVASKSYFKKLAKVESGGNYKAYNKSSGATGKYQFLKSTAVPILKGMGNTWDEFKNTPAIQDKVVAKFTENNAKYLKKHNVPVNDETLWWAHNQGAGGAKALYENGHVSSTNLKANGAPTGTNAEYIARWKPTFG